MDDPVNLANVAVADTAVAKEANARVSELFVSLNSIGVVSENADCILLKSDLGLLAQAFEIVHRRA